MDNVEYDLTDIVYFMFNNKPVKGIITNKCYQNTWSIDIPDVTVHNTIRNNPQAVMELMKREAVFIYQISIIPPDIDTIEYQPINGWFNADYLFDSKEELLSALAKIPV